eukprot:TRINITY_DN7225_c0_g1_i4.p1 TRINITY_DN7225_c0_g1~~TRINITY_DN7225_c0_g1_i4.p1  ORF type:complete len:169 (+),score=36.86 TRINITY_DN7225_c0_g1_i4:181-687(+)
MVRCKSDQAPDCEGYEYSTNEEDNADLSPYQPVHKPTYNGGMMSPPGSPPPNSLVNGRYQLGSTIGKGNDGTVVRAINVTTGKPLAIKITNRKRHNSESGCTEADNTRRAQSRNVVRVHEVVTRGDLEYLVICLLYTSDAADEEDSVDLGGRRIIKKKKKKKTKQTQR